MVAPRRPLLPATVRAGTERQRILPLLLPNTSAPSFRYQLLQLALHRNLIHMTQHLLRNYTAYHTCVIAKQALKDITTLSSITYDSQ
jgi:hypothetical protein